MAAGSEILTSSSTHQEHERFQDLLRDGDPESSVERRTAAVSGRDCPEVCVSGVI